MIIPLHSTTMLRDFTCPVPSGVSSSLLQVIVLVRQSTLLFARDLFLLSPLVHVIHLRYLTGHPYVLLMIVRKTK